MRLGIATGIQPFRVIQTAASRVLLVWLQRFLLENGLRLIIRSHEGPDARVRREDGMASMDEGYSVDHVTSG
jgi:hypothetical protein